MVQLARLPCFSVGKSSLQSLRIQQMTNKSAAISKLNFLFSLYGLGSSCVDKYPWSNKKSVSLLLYPYGSLLPCCISFYLLHEIDSIILLKDFTLFALIYCICSSIVICLDGSYCSKAFTRSEDGSLIKHIFDIVILL